MLVVNLSRDSEYHSQRNNRFIPRSSCNTTSAIMALKASGIPFDCPDDMQPEDYLTKLLQSEEAYSVMRQKYPWAIRGGYPPNEVHGMLAWGANKLAGYEADRFRLNGSLQEVAWLLFRGQALVMSGRFTDYGHMVCVVGFVSTLHRSEIQRQEDIALDQVVSIIIDDPYGNYHTNYQDVRGNNIKFSLSEFHNLTRDYNADGAKWMHVFQKRRAA